MKRQQKLKAELKWGFSPHCFILMISLIFTPILTITTSLSLTTLILSILCATLIIGIAIGSKIVLTSEVSK